MTDAVVAGELGSLELIVNVYYRGFSFIRGNDRPTT